MVINTYNAERFLREVIESARRFDEIVVCDMESTDSTRDIARGMGCRVVSFEKAGHKSAEPARQFAIQSAAHEWVLVIDADEIATPELSRHLYKVAGEADPPAGLWIPRRNRFMDVPEKGRPRDWQLRFFKRDSAFWPPYVHTMPQVDGRVERIPNTLPGVEIEHLAPNTVAEMVEKANRYTDAEMEKRAGKRYGWGALIARPALRFAKAYFLGGKIRYGARGFIDSCLTAYYQFIMVAKVIERRRAGGGADS